MEIKGAAEREALARRKQARPVGGMQMDRRSLGTTSGDSKKNAQSKYIDVPFPGIPFWKTHRRQLTIPGRCTIANDYHR
jgi:hypothetical protein